MSQELLDGLRTTLRGHAIEMQGGRWVYVDTGDLTTEQWRERPCGHCGLPNTPEGHDGCIGTLPGVINACCGHGDTEGCYLQYPDGSTVRGMAAVREIERLRTCPPDSETKSRANESDATEET